MSCSVADKVFKRAILFVGVAPVGARDANARSSNKRHSYHTLTMKTVSYPLSLQAGKLGIVETRSWDAIKSAWFCTSRDGFLRDGIDSAIEPELI